MHILIHFHFTTRMSWEFLTLLLIVTSSVTYITIWRNLKFNFLLRLLHKRHKMLLDQPWRQNKCLLPSMVTVSNDESCAVFFMSHKWMINLLTTILHSYEAVLRVYNVFMTPCYELFCNKLEIVLLKNKFHIPPAPQIDGTTTKSSYH
jgi:hypothetical protein